MQYRIAAEFNFGTEGKSRAYTVIPIRWDRVWLMRLSMLEILERDRAGDCAQEALSF